MCTAVRWCCCKLFVLSRRYPHGEHHARDIADTPETHQFVGTSSDTIHASYLPHRDQTNPVDPLEGHQETVGSADHNIQKNRANSPKRGHLSSPKVNTRQKHKTKIPKFNSTRKAKIPNNECGHAKCVVIKHQKLRRPHIPKSRLHLTPLVRSSLDLSFMSERMHSLRKKVHRFAVLAVSSVRVQIGAVILEAPCSGKKMCLHSGEFP